MSLHVQFIDLVRLSASQPTKERRLGADTVILWLIHMASCLRLFLDGFCELETDLRDTAKE